jgi:hypothetical protein
MVISLTSTCLSTHALSTASLTTRLLAGRGCDIQGSSAPLVPADLPNLELWLDANEGVLNLVGNNFTDETASMEVSSFPDKDNGLRANATYGIDSTQFNNKNQYVGNLSGGSGGAGRFRWDGTQWELRRSDFENDQEDSFYATGNTDYPWQATWADGTVTRTATTVDDPAANDETVRQWNNLVSGKPNLSQTSANLQPEFKSNVNGRKAVFFNGDVLSSSGFSTFGQQYSYYLVATTLGASSGTLFGAMRLGTSSLSIMGLFGANANFIGANNGTSRVSTLSNAVGVGHNIWSARFNVGNSGEAIVGSNKTHQTLASVGTTSANQSTILLGAASPSGASGLISNYSEILVYRAFHDETTANQIIDYLAAKWSIAL